MRSDTLHESLLVLARDRPLALLSVPRALLRGRAAFKDWVAERALPDPRTLPFHEPLVAWLRAEREEGRRIVLVSAADRRVAQSVADHVGLFDEVVATDGGRNLKGERKAEELVRRFGERGFDYAGDSRADLAVWRRARQAIPVGVSAGLLRAARSATRVERIFPGPGGQLRALARALRLNQWVKNLLVFVPLLAAHRMEEQGLLLAAVVAFFAFGLTASAIYVINDLLDLPYDRLHPRKSGRPFASGSLPLAWGAILAPALLAGATLLAWIALPPAFLGALALYAAVALAYSLRIKQVPVLDVMTLAGLYTLRLVAGGAAVSVPLSFWLLAFSMFVFLSLALVKRYAELVAHRGRGAADVVGGRGYRVDDLSLVASLGAAAGYVSVLVLALYIDSETASLLYSRPHALWLACPLLLYWISRIWLIAYRGAMDEDPLVYALRDRVSLAVLVLLFAAALVAM